MDDSLHLAGPKQDDVGLWVFPGAVPGGHQELVPIAQAQPGQVAAVSQSLTRVVPNGGTPLYRTMVDSAASVGPGDSATTSAAVIITDGEDTSSGLTPQSTAAQLPAGTRLIVLTLGEVRCNGPGLSALTTASSRVECVDADTDAAGLSARLDAVLDDIWSGR